MNTVPMSGCPAAMFPSSSSSMANSVATLAGMIPRGSTAAGNSRSGRVNRSTPAAAISATSGRNTGMTTPTTPKPTTASISIGAAGETNTNARTISLAGKLLDPLAVVGIEVPESGAGGRRRGDAGSGGDRVRGRGRPVGDDDGDADAGDDLQSVTERLEGHQAHHLRPSITPIIRYNTTLGIRSIPTSISAPSPITGIDARQQNVACHGHTCRRHIITLSYRVGIHR